MTRLLASATLPSPVTAILRTISGLRIEAAEDVGQLSGVPDRGRESGMGTGYSLMLISVWPGITTASGLDGVGDALIT